MPVLSPRERLGTRLAGKYQIERIIAVGGMGMVYSGYRVHDGTEVAVKLLKPHDVDDAGKDARFGREAQIGAQLAHPNVVDVIDHGRDTDGSTYLVMELLQGLSLEDELRATGSLSADDTLATLLPILGALAFAHGEGVIHRDIKPANIFVTRSRGRLEPKLLDFGIAKTHAGTLATGTGAVLGTPEYMSPEQATGGEIDETTDVWAMGVAFYRCLAGCLPFTGDNTPQILYNIVHKRPEPLEVVAPDVGLRLAMAIQRALSTDRNIRYQSPSEFARAVLLGAHADGIALPEDPDPVGLPDWRTWLAEAQREGTTTDRNDLPALTRPDGEVQDTLASQEIVRPNPVVDGAPGARKRWLWATVAMSVAGVVVLAAGFGNDRRAGVITTSRSGVIHDPTPTAAFADYPPAEPDQTPRNTGSFPVRTAAAKPPQSWHETPGPGAVGSAPISSPNASAGGQGARTPEHNTPSKPTLDALSSDAQRSPPKLRRAIGHGLRRAIRHPRPSYPPQQLEATGPAPQSDDRGASPKEAAAGMPTANAVPRQQSATSGADQAVREAGLMPW